MQGFQILQAGGRQKFLKKKKEKKAKVEEDNKQTNQILKIQKNIQRFLELKRANQNEENKIELQNESKHDQYWKYWLKTPYHLRNYNWTYYILQFWDRTINDLNQVQCQSGVLVNRMTKLTIEFLQQLLQSNHKLGFNICLAIFGLIRSEKYLITKSEVKLFLKALDQSNKIQIKDLKKDFIEILFGTQNTKSQGSELFADEAYFIEYLVLKRKDILNGKASFNQMEDIVIQFYPTILDSTINKIQVESKQESQWLWENYDQLTKLYTSILRWLQASVRSHEVILVWVAFLNNLLMKIKAKTLQEIYSKNKVNPKIFDSEEAYQEYVEQKEEYFAFKEILTGNDYQKTQNFMKKALEVIIKLKKSQEKASLFEQAMQYVNQVLIALGEIDLLPINQAVNFFLDSITETNIYGLGKGLGFSLAKNNLSHQNKILLALNITLKAAVQTPDLYFTKFYQEKEEKEKIKRLIKEYLLKTLKHTMFLPHKTPTIKLISKTTITLLENFYNKIFRTNILSPEIFESPSFAFSLKRYEFRKNVKDEVSLFLSEFPYVFGLQDRAMKFRQILREDRVRVAMQQNQMRLNANEDESDSDENQYDYNLTVKIRRNYEFVDAFDQLRKKDLRRGLNVKFINQLGFQEIGYDAGGLTKQFLNRVLKNALNPNYGMFIENSAHELLPHPIKAELTEGIETQFYEFIGKLIGLAIYLNITLGYKFSGTFLNAIVGKKNSFDDLKTIDPDLYKSLVYIKDMQEDASELGLTFMYTDNIRKRNIQLVPNGHLINVTKQFFILCSENKRQYISLLSAYKVNKLLEHQTQFIRKGLTSTIHKEWLFMFNYEELNYLISGQGQIDVADLRAYTIIVGFDEKQSKTIKYFWEVVSEYSEEQKSKLLLFITACPRPSFLGFKEMSPPITISCMKDKKELLPISHTCSNVLELPDYNDKETLKKKLTTAIESNAGFQFG